MLNTGVEKFGKLGMDGAGEMYVSLRSESKIDLRTIQVYSIYFNHKK